MTKFASLAPLTALIAVMGFSGTAQASDHDDGETDIKARSLNLTDHYVFKTPGDDTKVTLIMYVNPRSLPGYAYYTSTNARYEFHVGRVADKTTAAVTSSDVVLRFETGAADATGVQPVTFTVLAGGTEVGTHTGSSTSFANSKAGTVTTNTAAIGGQSYDYFVGMRADSFYFDVIRFFQVRAFLADRFFGGTAGAGNAAAALAPNCNGQALLAGIEALGGTAEGDGDEINLFNPPDCAPDFTKNYNVTSITVNVPIAALQASGETVFDTWSTISVPE